MVRGTGPDCRISHSLICIDWSEGFGLPGIRSCAQGLAFRRQLRVLRAGSSWPGTSSWPMPLIHPGCLSAMARIGIDLVIDLDFSLPVLGSFQRFGLPPPRPPPRPLRVRDGFRCIRRSSSSSGGASSTFDVPSVGRAAERRARLRAPFAPSDISIWFSALQG